MEDKKDRVRGVWGCQYRRVRIVGNKVQIVRTLKRRTSEGTGTVIGETLYVRGMSNNVRSENPAEK